VKKINDISVHHTENAAKFIKENEITIGVLCTPKAYSQDAADILIEGGVRAIWNFAPTDLRVPDNVIVENVNLIESLFTVSYLLKEKEEANIKKR
jgi:redox-sensing transcriptional repressor